MTLDLEPITAPSTKLDLEPVSGSNPNLDLEPVEQAQSKSNTEESQKALSETHPDRSWYTGNIDLATRPRVAMPGGQTATVRGISVDGDGGAYLIPTISDDGRVMTNPEAIQQFKQTGKHLGFFPNHQSADEYSTRYHSMMGPTVSEYSSRTAETPEFSFLPKSGTQTDQLEGREVLSDPAVRKPLKAIAKTAVGMVTGLPEFGRMVADPWSPQTLHSLLGQGAATAAQIKQVENSPLFSQPWWDATVPLTAQILGTVAGVKESFVPLERPPIQEVIPNASEITGPKSVPQPKIRTPVGQETPLRQQGEVAGTQVQEPVVAGAPQETNAVEPLPGLASPPSAETTVPALITPESVDAGTVPITADEPHVSAIANRFVKDRMARGEVGEIAPGQGFSTADLTQRGLSMPPEVINQHISDLMQGGGDPIRQGEAVRAEEARLSQQSNQLSRIADSQPDNVEAQVGADNAFKDLTDFHNGPVARLKQNWHAQGMGLQGEQPVDLTTFNGLREAWLKDTGEVPPESVEPILRRTARNVANSVKEEVGAMSKLGIEIEKSTNGRKLPTADEVRNKIREKMGLEPCR